MKKVRLQKNIDKELSIWQFKTLEYLGYLLVIIVPLYINYSHWMPIGIPKQFMLISIVCVMLIMYAWGKWNNPGRGLEITKLHGILGVFFTVLTVSALFGVDPKNSFFGTWQANVSLHLFYFIGIISVFIGFLIKRNPNFLPKLLTVSFATGVVVASITYFGKTVIRYSNDGSTLGNNSYLGAYLLLIVCFGIVLLFLSKKIWQKVIVGLGLITILMSPTFLNKGVFAGTITLSQIVRDPIILLGGANGAAIGLVVAVVVMIALFLTRHEKQMVRATGIGLFAILVGIIGYGWSSLMSPTSLIHREYVEQKSENRFVFWDIAREGFVEKPVLGYGFNNYSYIYQKYAPEEVFKSDRPLEVWVTRPHNIFWEYMSLAGIVGTVMFFILIGGVFIVLYKISGEGDYQRKVVGVTLAGAMFGYTIQNLFVFDTIVPLMMFFIIIGIALGLSKGSSTIGISETKTRIMMVVLGSVSIIALVFLVIMPRNESLAWGKLANESNVAKHPALRDNIQQLSIIGSIQDTAFLTDKTIKMIGDALPTLSDAGRPYALKEIDSLMVELEKQFPTDPNNYRSHLCMGNLALLRIIITKDQQSVYFEKGLVHFKKAIELSPANPMSYIGIGNLYGAVGNIDESHRYIRAAIAMAPTFPDSYKAARAILKNAPNREFANYVTTMESRWNMKQ